MRALILRDKALRAHPLALVILLDALPALAAGQPITLPTGRTAARLNADRPKVRAAVRWLLEAGWLSVEGGAIENGLSVAFRTGRKWVPQGPTCVVAPIQKQAA